VDDERAPLLRPSPVGALDKGDDCEERPLAVSIEDSPGGGYIVVHATSGPDLVIPMAVVSMPLTSSRAGGEQDLALPTRPLSPCLEVFKPSLRPTPPPPLPPSRLPPSRTILPSRGDMVLVNLLGNGRNPDIGIRAGRELLPPLDSVSWRGILRKLCSVCGPPIETFSRRILGHSCKASAAASEDEDSNDLQGECPDRTSDDGILDLGQPFRLSPCFAPGGRLPISCRREREGEPKHALDSSSGCPGGLRRPAHSTPLLREWREGSIPGVFDGTSVHAWPFAANTACYARTTQSPTRRTLARS